MKLGPFNNFFTPTAEDSFWFFGNSKVFTERARALSHLAFCYRPERSSINIKDVHAWVAPSSLLILSTRCSVHLNIIWS